MTPRIAIRNPSESLNGERFIRDKTLAALVRRSVWLPGLSATV